jgi:hypothetical protein
MNCKIKLIWDDEANVWYTDSNDVPGLNLESESFDDLVEKVRNAAPEMLELNCNYIGPVHLIFEAVRIEKGIERDKVS